MSLDFTLNLRSDGFTDQQESAMTVEASSSKGKASASQQGTGLRRAHIDWLDPGDEFDLKITVPGLPSITQRMKALRVQARNGARIVVNPVGAFDPHLFPDPTISSGAAQVTFVLGPVVTIDFQLAPGTAAGLGIAGLAFVVSRGGSTLSSGTTNAEGAIPLNALVLAAGAVTVRVLDTDYDVSIVAADLGDKLAGWQKRLDMLGYFTGYQLVPIASDVPDDGVSNTRTMQAVLNFQADQGGLDIDSSVGKNTKAAFKTVLGF